jgi:thiol-disulfide isomerase/thioredoxin
MSAAPPAPSDDDELLVACLCAQWCRTCETYRDTLAAVREELGRVRPHARLRFAWVDIEDESELIGDLDIEDFPTILLARGERVKFLGPVMPHAQTIERLVESALDDELGAPPEGLGPDALALPRLLAAHPPL